MDRLGGWLWRRHREHFVGVLWVVVSGVLTVALIGPATTSGALFLDITAGETVVWGCSAAAALGLASLVTYVSVRRLVEPIRRYGRGDESDPAAAWDALLRLPQTLGIRAFVAVVPLSLGVSLPVVLAFADPGPQGVIGLVYAHLVVCLSGVTLVATGAQLLVEAPATELSARLDVVDLPITGLWTIRRRLVVVTFITTTFAGLATTGVVLGTEASENDYLVAFLAGSVLAAYLLVVLDNGVFQPTVKPVRLLTDAAVRVRRGDLSTPVPVSTLDEMGELSAAFNEMQAGLRDRAALHAAFGSYVDPVLAERLLGLGLGDVRRRGRGRDGPVRRRPRLHVLLRARRPVGGGHASSTACST